MLIAFGTTLWIDLALHRIWKNRAFIQEVDGACGSVAMKRNVCVVVLIVCVYDINIFMILLLNQSS